MVTVLITEHAARSTKAKLNVLRTMFNVSLRVLRREEVVESAGSGDWRFASGELQISESEAATLLEPSDKSRPDTPGLYVYYYLSYAELAAFRGEPRMYGKIGSTGKIIADRVSEQVGTSTPEHPVIRLTVECTRDEGATLETAVHAVLKARGQHSPQSPGASGLRLVSKRSVRSCVL